jgi:hypothetical protein
VTNPKVTKIPGTYSKAPTPTLPAALPAHVRKELEKLQRAQPNTDTVRVSDDYEVQPADRILLVDSTDGSVTITMRKARTLLAMPLVIVKMLEDNNVIIEPFGNDTIGGEASLTLADVAVAYMFLPDGIDTWWVSSAYGDGAPKSAQYILKQADPKLPAARELEDTSTVAWDYATAGKAKANVPDGAIVEAKLAANAVTTNKIANDAVTYAKMQNVSATDKLLGRSSPGAGDVEEIACTAAGRALIDDANAAAQRATLGLGTVATLDVDTDGTLAANSDAKVATQKAVKTYVDGHATSGDPLPVYLTGRFW